MKELSIEEKAQRYDEALDCAKKALDCLADDYICNHLTKDDIRGMYAKLFPELNGSKDEKIRKEIINYINFAESHNLLRAADYEKKKGWITWLEKHGEQKPADKVKPKFHEGEWVVVDGGRIGRIIECTKDFADVDLEYSCLSTRVNNIRSWTIQDAKDGDVLVASDGSIFIFKDTIDSACKHYVALTTDDVVKFNEGLEHYWETSSAVHPATKEQRDILFQKMKKAGYEWDAEKKELKKIEDEPTDVVEPKFHEGDIIIHKELGGDYIHNPHKIIQVDILDKKYRLEGGLVAHFGEQDDYELVEQNHALNDEDIRRYNSILSSIKYCSEQYPCKKEYDKDINWLKDRVQPKQEWNQNDIDMIDWLIRCYEKEHEELCNDKYGHQDIVSDLKRDCRKKLDWLESLKNRVAPQKQWKPSEEQMKALDIAIRCGIQLGTWEEKALKSLKEQLFKLYKLKE